MATSVASLWPWLAMAAAGALHGLNPASGWIFIGCAGRARPLPALAAIACGHVAGVALAAAASFAALRSAFDLNGLALPAAAGAAMLGLAARRFHSHEPPRAWQAVGHAGLALWSFLMATVQGAGLMLVPLLTPICATGDAMGSEPLLLAVAAAGLHLASMLAATACMALGARRGFDALARWLGAAKG